MHKMDLQITGSRLWVIHFYQEQLDKFNRLGLGGITENNVEVTERLIHVTSNRLANLSVVYDGRLTSTALRTRSHRMSQAMKRRKLGANNNGTTITFRGKNNGDTGHEGGKS